MLWLTLGWVAILALTFLYGWSVSTFESFGGKFWSTVLMASPVFFLETAIYGVGMTVLFVVKINAK